MRAPRWQPTPHSLYAAFHGCMRYRHIHTTWLLLFGINCWLHPGFLSFLDRPQLTKIPLHFSFLFLFTLMMERFQSFSSKLGEGMR